MIRETDRDLLKERILNAGILMLCNKKLFESSGHRIGEFSPFNDIAWQDLFDGVQEYIEAILFHYPVFYQAQIGLVFEQNLRFEEYSSTFRNSGFMFFFSNTKALASLYPDVRKAWDACYEKWIDHACELVYPYALVSQEETLRGIRQVVNEAVMHPARYSNSAAKFNQLIRRHYQLALSEQKR